VPNAPEISWTRFNITRFLAVQHGALDNGAELVGEW
jgi:hypothetical protein